MKTLRAMCAFSLSTGGLLLACAGTNQSERAPLAGTERSPGVANEQNRADNAVVNELATAQCDREQACSNIGNGAKYVSREVCMEQIRGNTANDLNAYNCPGGIDRHGLNQCLSAIKGEECNHPLDTISRVDKCRTGALCIK